MIVEHRLHRLQRLAVADPDKRFDRLFREVAEPDFLMYASEQIRGNKGSGTPGVDGKTKANWSRREAERIATALREGTYHPMPVRRTYIQKKSGKMRPLGIPIFADRVVQSAVKIILEALYEPVFRDCSHGFRPGRGCHTALAAVYDSPRVRMDWIVEGDIQGCFDHISHQILMRLLQKRIKDDRFLKLIALFLKAGYFERDMWNPTKEGTPQGGIVSPILANIYLHEIDRHIEEEYGANQCPKQTDREMYERANPEHLRIQGRIKRLRGMLSGKRTLTGTRSERAAELRELLKLRKHTPLLVKPAKSRITYVRYADDFVIVLRNLPKREALRIKEELTQWVWDNLRLVLHPDKTAVTHITDGFAFLSYRFLRKKGDTGSQPRVKMAIPYDSMRAKLRDIREICARYQQPEVQVIHSLNGILRGWMYYFGGVNSPSRAMRRVLSSTWWAYGRYVASKNRCSLKTAAGRWLKRCPPSPLNPRGGQKTWMASTTDRQGKRRTEYLICYVPPKRTLHEIARSISRKARPESDLQNRNSS